MGSFESPEVRRAVMSYGNRLFCDRADEGGALVHRWGSSKLYRAYFEDSRSFLQRPEAVAASLGADDRILIVQTDLRQFYDSVTQDLLPTKVGLLQTRRSAGWGEGV